ncbi:ATP-binding protein [Aureibacter tunicatorum]|uniref:AAA+ ATPase domain-containing protein n=1 Tax=Aureibacter tunicatorum TaxID=866807 RepID=A0AAE3XN71_9BACT|nr:ATP-binding protein [Aureibacter tunicatorum]MDR6240047.1 hypothetical protein [Aureibacter tunicatorum]BDD04519.1 hypothetical protein AUTU_20020 [Aureibacter tunicatorum]
MSDENTYQPEELLIAESLWIEALIQFRIKELCGNLDDKETLPDPPEVQHGLHAYFNQMIHQQWDMVERVAMGLALCDHLFPHLLDALYTRNEATDVVFTEFGVKHEGNPARLKISWQTVVFLCLSTPYHWQTKLFHYTHPSHRLYQQKMLNYPDEEVTKPFLLTLKINPDWFNASFYTEELPLWASNKFPADRLESPLNWADLQLETPTYTALEEMKAWLQHEHFLLTHKKFGKMINEGIRVAFYGPSGTGKTLTASLLGKEYNRPVYRVDLSKIVSKWVGETEKNLGQVFDHAEDKKWILFFDEADALFATRGAVENANDKRANQEVAYLLQRMENFNGVIIIATNLLENIDPAFIRRFQLMIEFPMPEPDTRLKIWKNVLSDTFPWSDQLDLDLIAQEYELTGGNIKNIFRSLTLKILNHPEEDRQITQAGLEEVIHQELKKKGIYRITRQY